MSFAKLEAEQQTDLLLQKELQINTGKKYLKEIP
jgi:hypothetical protein